MVAGSLGLVLTSEMGSIVQSVTSMRNLANSPACLQAHCLFWYMDTWGTRRHDTGISVDATQFREPSKPIHTYSPFKHSFSYFSSGPRIADVRRTMQVSWPVYTALVLPSLRHMLHPILWYLSSTYECKIPSMVLSWLLWALGDHRWG